MSVTDGLSPPPNQSTTGAAQNTEWQQSWRVVLSGASGLGLTYGLFLMTAGLFIAPMQASFGWSRTALMVGPMVTLGASLLNPVAAACVGRFGARSVAIAGISALSSSMALFSILSASPVAFASLVVMASIGCALTSAIVYTTGVISWFTLRVGSAIGITMAGISVSSAILMPVVAYIIDTHGWRRAYQTLAACMLLALPGVLLWFRQRPASAAADVEGAGPHLASCTLSDALRDKRFWLLMAALNGAALMIGGFLSHMPPLMASIGVPPIVLAVLGSTFAVSIAAGRIGSGLLLDRWCPILVTSACLALPAIGNLLLGLSIAGQDIGFGMIAAVSLIGLAQGAEASFPAYFAIKLFGRRHFPAIFGILGMVNALCFALGGLIFSAIFDTYGHYRPAVYLSIAVFAASSALILAIRAPGADGSSAAAT